MNDRGKTWDCIIVGAGPGGLQAAIHLARYNFSVLLFHRPGGRTRHARHIENFLGHPVINGADLIETGLAQVRRFGVRVEERTVNLVTREGDLFSVTTGTGSFRSRFVIAASGASENYPRLKNLDRFFGRSYFTCLVCDGYRTTGKKLLVIENDLYGVRLSLAMKRMFTVDVTFLSEDFALPEDHAALLAEEGIPCVQGKPVELLGERSLEGVRLADGREIACEVIMGGHGIVPNDAYLRDLHLEREPGGRRIRTKSTGESSLPGLFVLGALRPGHSQVVISAGQGAEAALEIGHRLVEI